MPETLAAKVAAAEITPSWLRSIGFRLDVTHADNQPHMVWMYDSHQEVAIEASRSIANSRGWTCWLRSDLAHSRCRFCYVRTVETRDEMLALLRGVGGKAPQRVEFDEAQFQEAWTREEEDSKRRYLEYARGERWGRVPG